MSILRNVLSTELHSHGYRRAPADPLLTVRLQEGGPVSAEHVLRLADDILQRNGSARAQVVDPDVRVHVQVVSELGGD